MNPQDIATKQDLITLRDWINERLTNIEKKSYPLQKNLNLETSTNVFLKKSEVLELLSISDSALYRHVKCGNFKRTEIAPGIFRFRASQFNIND